MSIVHRSAAFACGAVVCLALATPALAGGANTSGPYNPSNVGAPSGHGQGKGNAYGKPAAGTVGNADAKNPPGQLPGPQDGNNGYECDGNSGIARGTPAHSFCEDIDEEVPV